MPAPKLLEGEFREGQTVEVDCRDDELVFTVAGAAVKG